jgi:hypothetical protein
VHYAGAYVHLEGRRSGAAWTTRAAWTTGATTTWATGTGATGTGAGSWTCLLMQTALPGRRRPPTMQR